MATDNRGVMVYLNPELEREIEQYCIDNDITRKHKDGAVLPSLGTGIIQYLKSTLLSTAPRTVPSPSLGAVPHLVPSTSLNNAPSHRLTTGITKAEILELIAESNTSRTPSTVLTREEVVAIVREEIEAAAASLPLAFVPSVESVTAANPQDPTNWEEPIAKLAAEGMSSRQIADELNLLGFTNTKGGAVSRQSIESYLSRRPALKAVYEKARKKGTKPPTNCLGMSHGRETRPTQLR